MIFAKYSIPFLFTIVALIVGFYAVMMLCFPFAYVVPDIAIYPNDVTFSASPSDTLYGPFMWNRPRRSYTAATWIRKDNKTESICPIGATIDGKSWAAKDLEWDRFIEAGAIDENEKARSDFGPGVMVSELPKAYVYSEKSNVRIYCIYEKDKTIKEVYIATQPLERDAQGKQASQPDFQITIPQGTVTLPADHPALVRQLGKPLKYIPAHTYNGTNASL